jgi:hypothetical protein
MLVRKLAKGSKWKVLLAENPNISALDLPSELFAEFIPRDKDDYWLSLYQIDDEALCADIAAALSFLLKPAQASEQFFLALDDEYAAGIGLPIKATPGATFHSPVDEWHREIHLPTANHTARLLDAFLTGDLISAKGSQVDSTRAIAVRSGKFRIAEAAKNPKANDNPCGHILTHVGLHSIVPAGMI